MSPCDHDDDLLRRALQMAAESVEPADDGLERILARVTVPYPMPVAWMVLGLSRLTWRTRAGLQHVSVWLRTPRCPAGQRSRPASPRRLRHAAALVLTGIVVAAGALMLTPIRQQAITQAAAFLRSVERSGSAGGAREPGPSDHDRRPAPGGTSGVTAAGYAPQGHRQPATASCTPPGSDLASPATTAIAGPSMTATPVPGLSRSVNLTTAAPTACSSPAAGVTPGVTPLATPTPTVTPTVTPSTTPTPTVTPTVTPSTTPTPTGTPSVTPSTGATPSASP